MKLHRSLILARALALACLTAGAALEAGEPPASPGLVKKEFVADNPPFPSSHASTIVETPDGLVAAWFGGAHERAPDVSIWLAHNVGAGWSAPEEVANGSMPDGSRRYPCWNPVLFRRSNEDLLLFYKVGPSPENWWGMVRLSRDNGKTWIKVRRLPAGFVGPVRNKPLELADGTLLCGSSSEDKGWRAHVEWTKNPFGLWNRGPTLNAAFTCPAIQPTLLAQEGGLQMLVRTKQGRIFEAWATNGHYRWSALARTALPNPNSAIDAVKLRDGRSLLVYNHTTAGRAVMNVAVSTDGGASWQALCELENEAGSEFSYPAVIQTSDGLVHTTYTWKRQRIRHVVFDPDRFTPRPMPDGQWR
jgi:predicted neuraminidase